MAVIEYPSPNHGERLGNGGIRLIVLHFTGMPDLGAALERLCDPEAEVSCHYLVARSGEVVAMVPEDRRAWHAGEGSWGGVEDINSRSIGIEIDNSGQEPFDPRAMSSLVPLLKDILARHDLPPEAVIGHQDMAPGRKDDPGPLFDWRGLADAGVSVWPEVPHAAPLAGAPADRSHWRQFCEVAEVFGYPTEVSGEALHTAFRARFRGDQGRFDPMDTAMAMDLARRFPARMLA